MKTVTINNTAGEDAYATLLFMTANGTAATLGVGTSSGSVQQIATVPANRQVSGDLHLLSAWAGELGPGANSARYGQRVFAAGGDLTVDLGPALTLPQVVV